MSVLEIIGAIVVGSFGIFASIVILEIVGNIYGGIKGAYRLREIHFRTYDKRYPHAKTIKLGLRAWTGRRYKDGYGAYYQIGAMRVPIDGRDKIGRDRYYPG